MIAIRALSIDELHLAEAIDVTEDGSERLEQHGVTLSVRSETWHRPPRFIERWQELEAGWRTFLPAAGAALGAFEDGRLVGIATLRRAIRPGTDQLEALWVDRGHRRLGIASALVAGIEERARAGGAHRLYVSAAPSRSAVGFYLGRGFLPTAEPIRELLELVPEDIQLVLEL